MWYPTSKPVRLVILGAGLGGTNLLRKLTRILPISPPIEITLINPIETLGRGVPFIENEGYALLNRPVENMDFSPQDKNGFLRWAIERGQGGTEISEDFLPRQVFGSYLLESLADSLNQARARGITVNLLLDRVSRLQVSGECFLITQSGKLVQADVAVVAMGGLTYEPYDLGNHERYVRAREVASKLKCIHDDATVGILGTSLSAIEITLTLLNRGHRGTLLMASREGRLPSVRGRNLPWSPLAFTPEAILALTRSRGELHLSDIARLLQRELSVAHTSFAEMNLARYSNFDPIERLRADIENANASVAWQSVLAAINEATSLAWHHLRSSAKKVFLKRFHRAWMTRRVPIPVETAKLLLSALESGKIRIVSGLRDVQTLGSDGLGLASSRGRTSVDWVVEAIGEARTVSPGSSTFLDQAIAEGLIAPNPMGGLQIDFESLRLKNKRGEIHPNLYALGGLTCGEFYLTSAIDVISTQVDRIAQEIVKALPTMKVCERRRTNDFALAVAP